MGKRPIPEEPRRAPTEGLSAWRTVRPLVVGLAAILVLAGVFVGLGYLGRQKSATRGERARAEAQGEGSPTAQQLGAPLKTYPALTAGDREQLKDTVAVVETDFGRFAFELYPEVAPQTVQNFVWLVQQRFYDQQLVAGGKPLEGISLDGFSQEAEFQYRIPGEFSNLEVEPGTVLLERAIDPGYWEGEPEKQEFLDSGSTRLWVALAPKPPQIPKFAVLGKVIAGLEVIEELSLAFTQGFPDYVDEVLVYRVRLVPRSQLQAVLAEPLVEPAQVPWAPERSLLPPG